MSEIMDAFWATPPLARTVATAILVTSLGVHMALLPYTWIYFTESRLLRVPPEIWRLITSFLLSGPQLSIILDPYFIYQYLSQLETTSAKFSKKEDLVWYLMTVGGLIIVLNRLFTGYANFLPALIVALCYTATQDQRGARASFIFFTVPAQLVPYCMILFSLLTNPASIPLQLSGLVAAHFHDFLTRLYPEFGGGPNLLPTPAFISRLIETPRVMQRGYGTAIRNSGNQGSGSGTGASTGPLPDSWRTRGSGHRLGSD